MPEVLHAVCFFWWILMELVLLWQETLTVTWTFWMWYWTSSLPLYSACHSPVTAPTLTQVPFSVLLRLLWALLLSLCTTLSLSVILLPPAAATAACVVTGQSEFFCKPPSNWLKNKERQGNAGLFWKLGASKTPRGCVCVCVCVCGHVYVVYEDTNFYSDIGMT